MNGIKTAPRIIVAAAASRCAVRRAAVVVAAATASVLVGTTAFAVLTGFSGTAMTQMRAVTETAPSSTQGPVWVNVPGAVLFVPATAGSTFRARFSGESKCQKDGVGATSYCHTRIVLVGGAEFHPQSGADYRWDNTSDGDYEAHAMERLLRAPGAGVFQLRVQYSTDNAQTQLTLDDWTFTADTIVP